jgi:hypothetical protein
MTAFAYSLKRTDKIYQNEAVYGSVSSKIHQNGKEIKNKKILIVIDLKEITVRSHANKF